MNKELSKETLSIPVIFQKKEEYSVKDTRFTKVKIWLMHTGVNENGSCFSRESIEKAIPTLANTPILAYIEDNSRGDKDFSDHRHGFVTEDGERKYKYLGSAYGVIPESHNAHFEKRLCDDGVEREYLVVDGLMWNKLEDGIDILSKFGVKGQSMELDDENYDGHFDENRIFHFTRFIFYGACLLGIDSQPAMANSTVEIKFCKDLKSEIRNKLEIFKEYVKGGASVDKEKESTTEKEKEVTPVETEHANGNKKPETECEKVETEHATEEETEKVANKDGVKTEHASEEEGKEKEEPEKSDEEEPETEHTKEEDGKEKEENTNFQIEYESLKAEHDELKKEFAQLKAEREQLVEFKNSTLKDAREKKEKALFETYDADLDGVAEYEELKKKASEFTSVEELEKEIALVFTKNVKKSFTRDVSTRTYFDNDMSTENSRYGYLAEKYK